jgi:hypothetical protein
LATRHDSSQRAHQSREHRFSSKPQQTEREGHRSPDLRGKLNVIERRGQPRETGLGTGPEGETGLVAAHQDVLQSQRAAGHTKARHVEECLCLGRERPEALAHFVAEPINVA